MPRHWFLKTKNGKAGPITSKALVRLVGEGKIKPASGISADGIEWIQASAISGLPFAKAEPNQYWVKTRGGDAGPFTLPKLTELAAAGRVKPNVMVSADGKCWKQAKCIAGLSFPKPPLPTPPISRSASIREAEFQKRFGARSQVLLSDNSSIAVQIHPASDVRPVTTLVTSGLSDHAMPVSTAAASPRAELILYVEEATPELIRLITKIAEHAVEKNVSFFYGGVYEHGEPMFSGSEFDGCIFMVSNVPSDEAIRHVVSIEGQPLQMLWVVPTTSLERLLISRHGLGMFCQLLDESGCGLVVDPSRACVVKSRQPQRSLQD